MADVLEDLRKVLRKHGYVRDESGGEGGIVEEALDIPVGEAWVNFKTKDSVVLTELPPNALQDVLYGEVEDDEDEEE